MRGAGRWLMVLAAMGGAFAGSAFMQWLTLGGGVAQASGTQQLTAKEMRSQAFVLVDADGRARATLQATAEGTGLIILGASGKPSIEIGADGDGPGIGLRDEQTGNLLLGIGADTKGSGITLSDGQGRERMSLGVTASGAETAVVVYYGEDRPAISLGYGPTGSGISLWDAEGRERAGAGMPPGGGASFVTRDESGKEIWRSP